ncbi:MAG: hypothetical protein ACPLZ9_04895, partial [Candidatus Ratteibacteria bacterium]
YERKLENIPIIIKGNILEKAGIPDKIPINSIRIIENSKEIPYQVDEKDNTGLFKNIGNKKLDMDDEVVFQITLNPNEEKNLFIYFTKELSPVPNYLTDIQFKTTIFEIPKTNYNAELSNSTISIGIRGSAEEKDNQGKPIYGGFGKASITSFKIKDKQLIQQFASWAWTLGGSNIINFALPWDNPQLLIDGPIRKIVVCKAIGQDRDFTKEYRGDWALTGKVKGDYFRYFILYSKIPYCQMIETIKIEESSSNYTCLYQFFWNPTCPRDWENDKLYIPEDEKAIVINFQDKKNYSAQRPKEGWLAIVNTRDKNGLAIFFDGKNAKVFADFYGAGLIREQILNDEWGKKYWAAEARIWYEYNNFNSGSIKENKFGFYGVTNENADEIRFLYKAIWEGEGLSILFGSPEEYIQQSKK